MPLCATLRHFTPLYAPLRYFTVFRQTLCFVSFQFRTVDVSSHLMFRPGTCRPTYIPAFLPTHPPTHTPIHHLPTYIIYRILDISAPNKHGPWQNQNCYWWMSLHVTFHQVTRPTWYSLTLVRHLARSAILNCFIFLLYKLHQQGATSYTLNWIKAFLLGRTQCVALEGETSSHISDTSGVPQWSVLGPILFLLYINDLPEQIHSQVRLFADDTAICSTVDSKNDGKPLQQDLQNLNIGKRIGKCISTQINVKSFTYHGQEIQLNTLHHSRPILQEVDHTKYLRLEISPDLSWNIHIQNVTVKANRNGRKSAEDNMRDGRPCVVKMSIKDKVKDILFTPI